MSYDTIATELCVSTITAEANVTGNRLDLTWTFATPTNADWGGCLLVRKLYEYPSYPNDGVTVLTISEADATYPTTFSDVGVLENTCYYYAMFSYDKGGAGYIKYYKNILSQCYEVATSAWGLATYTYNNCIPRIYRIEDSKI